MAEKKKKKDTKEKPLDKMTAKELRELALTTEVITGVHAMNKAELISAIKHVRGIVDDSPKKGDSSVREIKQKIRDLKAKRLLAVEADEKDKATTLRRRISRLKKRTRRAA